jgi:hypothetical protein
VSVHPLAPKLKQRLTLTHAICSEGLASSTSTSRTTWKTRAEVEMRPNLGIRESGSARCNRARELSRGVSFGEGGQGEPR